MGDYPYRLKDKTSVDVFTEYKKYFEELKKTYVIVEAIVKVNKCSPLKNLIGVLGGNHNKMSSGGGSPTKLGTVTGAARIFNKKE